MRNRLILLLLLLSTFAFGQTKVRSLIINGGIGDTTNTVSEDGWIRHNKNNGNYYAYNTITGYWDEIGVVSSSASFSSVFYVDQYGAVGDGVTDDTDAINACITAAGLNSVIVFTPDKTYLIKGSVISTTNIFIGYGATLKRADAISTTTTASVANGATSFPVADASIFQIGDEILLTDSTLPFGGVGFAENSAATNNTVAQTITNIVGNTITVSPAIFRSGGGSFPSGSNCFKQYSMVVANTTIEIYGLTFDGNKNNNDLNYSWIFNSTIRIKPESIISGCKFINTSNENIFAEGDTIIKNCFAQDLNGSFVHVSKSGVLRTTDIVNCHVLNSNIIGNAIMVHAEAAICFSASVVNLNVSGCTFENVNASILGQMQSDDGNILFENNICKTALKILDCSLTLTNVTSGLTMTGNIFTLCGDITISSSQLIAKGYGMDKVNISNNTFTGTKIFLSNTTNFHVDNNVFTFVDGETVSTASTTRTAGVISLANCAIGSITKNKFTDYNATENTNLRFCIALDVSTARDFIKSDASTETIYIYGLRGITVSDNVIAGFSVGIMDDYTTLPNGTTTSIGTSIKGNTIIMRADASANYAIRAFNGVSITNNKIYGNSTAETGIVVYAATLAASTTCNGPFIANNEIYGCAVTMQMDATRNYNAVIINNSITAAITGTTSNSIVSGNNILSFNQNATPLALPRQNPGFY